MTRLKAWLKDFDKIKARKRAGGRGARRGRQHVYESKVLAVRIQEVHRQRRTDDPDAASNEDS
jgi:hypothetical protein